MWGSGFHRPRYRLQWFGYWTSRRSRSRAARPCCCSNAVPVRLGWKKKKKAGGLSEELQTLDPLERAFLVGPHVAYYQDGEENRHLPHAEPTHKAVPYCPW